VPWIIGKDETTAARGGGCALPRIHSQYWWRSGRAPMGGRVQTRRRDWSFSRGLKMPSDRGWVPAGSLRVTVSVQRRLLGRGPQLLTGSLPALLDATPFLRSIGTLVVYCNTACSSRSSLLPTVDRCYCYTNDLIFRPGTSCRKAGYDNDRYFPVRGVIHRHMEW
jgi:hypothetical protein